MQIQNKYLDDLFKRFNLHFIVDENNLKLNFKDINFSDSRQNALFVNEYSNSSYSSIDFYIICFQYDLIIIPISLIDSFLKYFQKCKVLKIYCFTQEVQQNIQKINIQKVNIQKKNIQKINIQRKIINISENHYFQEEINSFILEFRICFKIINYNKKGQILKFWDGISRPIASFLIKKSHLENKYYNRFENFYELFYQKIEEETIESNEFIKLRQIGNGCSSIAYLIYHIKKEKLLVLKQIYNKLEEDKLFEREKENLMNIHHPLIPRYYGKTKIQSNKGLIIDYFHGKSLSNIELKQTTDEQKMRIILQIMVIIDYIHYYGFIYRELKPSSFIVMSNFTVFLIDFDRMVNNKSKDDETTKDFGNKYVSPEVYTGDYSNKADIYSLGMIISYIFSNNFPKKYSKLQQLCQMCISQNENNRPPISNIIDFFFRNFYIKYISIKETFLFPSSLRTHCEPFFPYWFFITQYHYCSAQSYLATMKYLLSNESNAGKKGIILANVTYNIDYLMYLSKLNYSKPQFILGKYYFEGEYVKKDVNKALEYLTYAANKNDNVDVLCYLGIIYSEGKEVLKDLKKAEYYYSLAAKQNCGLALYNLGILYSYELEPPNIKKGIHYFTLASKQQCNKANISLGKIYNDTNNDVFDINKAIYWYTLAAQQGDTYAINKLGSIYLDGIYIQKDIIKAIHFYIQGAKKKDHESEYKLGVIFTKEMTDNKYIRKGIHYFELAAEGGNPNAQYYISDFYLKGDFIPQDIEKGIYYLEKAANNGSTYAQLKLGQFLINGDYVVKNVSLGIEYCKKAAKQKNVDALFIVGSIYYYGDCVPKDLPLSFHYFSLAAEQNFFLAQAMLGNYYYHGIYVKKDINKALEYLLLAAGQKDQTSLYFLGYIYYYDFKNYDKGIEYFKASNSPLAQYELGKIYSEGENVTKDMNKAISYFRLAAKKNHKKAQYRLGMIFLNGTDIQKNIDYAVQLFIESSENGFFASYFILGFIYQQREDIERDIQKSISYYKDASSFNIEYAKNNLGVIYKMGIKDEIPQNIGYAIVYFNEAINQKNDTLSIYNLVHTYLFDIPNDTNYDNSIELLLKYIEKTKENKPLSNLLCLAFLLRCKLQKEAIFIYLNKSRKHFNSEDSLLEFVSFLFEKLERNNYYQKQNFQRLYQKYKSVVFLYDEKLKAVPFKDQIVSKSKKITIDKNKTFYDGFGDDLL